jgi:hypothetical protein
MATKKSSFLARQPLKSYIPSFADRIYHVFVCVQFGNPLFSLLNKTNEFPEEKK